MKILHLTKTRAGGAGVAAVRTVDALNDAGIDALLVTEGAPGFGPRSGTWRRWWLDKLDSVPTRLRLRRRKFSAWSNNWRRTWLAPAINAAAPDVVHLHWTAQGFLSLDEVAQIQAPIIWTLHDTWLFTGGCHYPGDCRRFETGCGACPQLASDRSNDLSARNWRAKRATLGQVRKWIAPSNWLAACAALSPWIDHAQLKVIPYALDVEQWNPLPQIEARRQLSMPDDALIFVAGAMDVAEPRKGCALLMPALQLLAARARRPIHLLLFGSGRLPQDAIPGAAIRSYGRLKSQAEIVRLYSAADAMLMPSLQDNLPCVVMEAQACGCPVIGFNSGGIGEIVETGRTGWLVSDRSAEALAGGIRRWQEVGRPSDEVSTACRERMRALYAPAAHAAALFNEYETVVSARTAT